MTTTRKILVGLGVVVIVMTGLYLSRGLIADVIAKRYEASINRAFPEFYKLDNVFKQTGIRFESEVDHGPVCENGPFSVSSPCGRYRTSYDSSGPNGTVSDSFIKQWPKQAVVLDQAITRAGWKLDQTYETKPLAKLFVFTQSQYQSEISYTQTLHGAHCSVRFSYDGPNIFEVTEDCSRMGSWTHFW